MVYVQTIEKASCTIKGDQIQKDGDFFIIKNGETITGVFDIGAVKFMYLTQPRERK